MDATWGTTGTARRPEQHFPWVWKNTFALRHSSVRCPADSTLGRLSTVSELEREWRESLSHTPLDDRCTHFLPFWLEGPLRTVAVQLSLSLRIKGSPRGPGPSGGRVGSSHVHATACSGFLCASSLTQCDCLQERSDSSLRLLIDNMCFETEKPHLLKEIRNLCLL